jgi:hypothetical protein
MRILDDFLCTTTTCGHEEERLHPQGVSLLPCPECGGEMRRVIPRLQQVENFGMLGVAHTPGRRLSPFEQERREHKNRQLGIADVNADRRPKIFS